MKLGPELNQQVLEKAGKLGGKKTRLLGISLKKVTVLVQR